MNKKLKMILSGLVLIALIAIPVFAALLWQSGIVERTLVIEWGDAVLIDNSDVGNYVLKVSPSTIQETEDARSDTMGLVLLNENMGSGDLLLTVDVTGAPENTITTVKMAWSCTFRRHYLDEHDAFEVIVFDDGENPQEVLVDGVYQTIDDSTFREIGVGTTLLNAELPLMLFEDPQGKYFNEITEPGLSDCNGIWILFSWDVSSVVGYGEFSLGITASLSEI